MSGWRPHSLRSLRHEAILLFEIAVIPIAIAFVFPYEAVGFRAEKREQQKRPSFAFVVLSEEEERVVLAAARTSWQVGAKGVKGLRTDISSGELPPAPIRLVMPTRPKRDEVFAPVEYTPNALPPTVAAPAPAVIAPEVEPDPDAKRVFSKEELLKID